MRSKVLAVRRPWVNAWVVGAAVVAMTMLVAVAAGAHPHKRHHGTRVELKGAFLGVTMQELTDELRKGLNSKAKNGVLVSSVVEGSAAEKAGIEEGDIIIEIDGKKVESPDAVREIIGEKEVGDEVDVKYVREGKAKDIEVTLGDMSDVPPMVFFGDGDNFHFGPPGQDHWRAMVANLRPRSLGVRVHEMDQDLSSYFGVKEGEGVLVLGVEDETTAKVAGIKAGDVIVAIGEESIESVSDIRDAMSEVEDGDKIDITVVRKNKRVKLEGEVQEASAAWSKRFPREMQRLHRGFGGMDDDLRKEVDELRKELDELKKELDKS